MNEQLEANCKQDEAKVGEAYDFPREAVKETNLVVDDGRRTRFLTVRTGRIVHVIVAP